MTFKHNRFCLCVSCSGVDRQGVGSVPITSTCPACGTPDGLIDQVHELCVAVLSLSGCQPVDAQETVQETLNFAKEFIRSGVQSHATHNYYQGVK